MTPPSGGATPFLPYLTNVTDFPAPDSLPNESGSLLLPQLSTFSVGGVPMVALVYVRVDSWGDHLVEFRTAEFSAAISQSVDGGSFSGSCDHVPLQWTPPVYVATYGFAPIQQISFATGEGLGFTDAVAVSSNGTTEVYVSAQEGGAGWWYSLTGSTPIFGDHPKVVLNGCTIDLTTLNPNGANLTMLSVKGSCGAVPEVQPSGGDYIPPSVVNVVPQQALPGTSVIVHGTGVGSATNVYFGSASASFSILNATALRATVPSGGGWVNVTVKTAPYGTVSPVVCDDEFLYGATLPAGTPQVESLTPSSGGPNTSVTIDGINVGNAVGVLFGSVPASFTRISATKLTAVAPAGSGVVNVSVVNPKGSSVSPTCATHFAYPSPPPSVSSVTVEQGLPGTSVVINGTGLSNVKEVVFGGTPAVFQDGSPTSLTATVPPGTGTVNVTVWNVYGESARNCSDEFAYGPAASPSLPQIAWISPDVAGVGATVTVEGPNIGSATAVRFGSATTTFSRLSPTEIHVTVPSGSGTVALVVSSAAGGSPATCASAFRYSSAPTVSNLLDSLAPQGGTIGISGQNFVTGAAVYFGSQPSTDVQYKSSDLLQATAPPGSGTVPVRVVEGNEESPSTCSDLFTYGPWNGPRINSAVPAEGPSNTTLAVSGANLSAPGTDTRVFVGGIPVAPSLASPNLVTVLVPQGIGDLPIRDSGTEGISAPSCGAEFTDWGPTLPPSIGLDSVVRTAVALPVLTDAEPVLVGTPYPTVIGSTSGPNPQLTLYNFRLMNQQFEDSSSRIIPINESRGLAVFGSIGDTRLSSGWLDPGLVAAAYSGAALFVAVTTDSGGRSAIATLVSTTNGSDWTGPYLSAATEGSATDPVLSTSPAGYVFESWLAGGPSGWTVQLAVYGGSGSLLRDPEALPGASDTSPGIVVPPTLTVDPLMRPILAWSSPASDGSAQDRIEYTGAFAAPVVETGALWWAFNSTVPADYENFGQPGLSQFQQNVTALFNDLEAALRAGNLCDLEGAAYSLYGYVTRTDPSPIVLGPAPTGCHAKNGPDNSILENASGAMVANYYLGVEAMALLESIGVGTMPIPAWGSNGANLPPSIFVPGTSGTASDPNGDSVSVTPWSVTPNSMWLNATGAFQGRAALHTFTYQGADCGSWTLSDQPSRYNVTVSIDHGASSVPFSSTLAVPSVFVTDLTPMQQGSWSEQVTTDFTTTNQSINTCSSTDGFHNGTFAAPTPVGWPSVEQLDPGGTFTTGLSSFPAAMSLASRPGSASGTMNDTLNWSNTLDANANLWLNASCNPSCNVHWSNSTYRLAERAEGQGLQQVKGGVTYQLTFRIQSNTGLGNDSWQPIDSAGQVSAASPPESVQFSCTLTQSSAASQTWLVPSSEVTNVTGTSALVSWYSGQPGTGWVTYGTPGGTEAFQAAQTIPQSNGSAEYFAELHGLEPFADYVAVGHVQVASTCSGGGNGLSISVNYSGQTSSIGFQTLAQVPVEEQDLPFDSITQQGGGAVVFWRIPDSFGNGSTLDNGTFSYYPEGNTSAAVAMPLSPPLEPLLSAPGKGSHGGALVTTYGVNLSALSANTTYVVNLTLNYTLSNGHPIVVTGEPYNFTYRKDSSGDGLTDWEKLYGWNVTYWGFTEYGWGWHTESVTASPALYATNGLVSDFVEKEYGLNPQTLDTAGSHMLDTWNLTFDLGSSSACPSDFRCWYENGSNPFRFAPAPGVSPPSGDAPVSTNSTNNAHWTKGGLQDDRVYDAEVLWSGGALPVLENLVASEQVGWLRGLIMKYGGDYTLTVWGKLSWGANPLALSTPIGYTPDGARINPLHDVGLEFGSVYANASGLGTGTGTGFAVRMFDNYTDPYGYARHLENYSSQGLVGNATVPTVSDYAATLPVTQTSQYQAVSLEVVANESSGLRSLPINGTSEEVNVTYDLLGGGNSPVNGVGSGSTHASLSGTFNEVPMGVKDPTWLWVPTDNATVNGLPLGLERYTGERSFDLVTINDSTSGSVASDPIPLPWGGTTTGIALSPGLNSILVPRQQFLDSPFGQAIFLGRNTSYNASGSLPLVGSSEENYLGFGGANRMVDLGAYWQNRAIATNSGSLILSSETGTPTGNPAELQVMAASSATTANTGGLPSDPGLYSTVGNPSALQSIVTLNVSSTDTLDLLLAALIDNTTGGSNAVNGTLQSITYQVGFLGLSPTVVNAIPNATEPSDGLYGAPASQFPPPPAPSGWGAFWNAVTNFLENPLGTIFSLVDTVWNAATAAFTYLDHLAHEAAAIGAKVLARTAAAIVAVGVAIAQALNDFLEWVAQQVAGWLGPVIAPIVSGMDAYALRLGSDLEKTYNDSTAGHSTAGDVAKFWADVGGSVFLLGMGVGTAVVIALALIEGFSLGASFLVPIVIGTLVTGALAATARSGGPTYVTDFENLNPISGAVATEWGNIFDPPAFLSALGPILESASMAWTVSWIEAAYDGTIGGPTMTQWAGLVMGIVGFVTAAAAAQLDAGAAATVSIFFASSGIILSAVGLIRGGEEPLAAIVGVVLDTGTIAVDVEANGWA